MPTMQEKRLAEFRIRLESDPQLRRDFDAAPLGVLKKAGVQVSPAQARMFRQQVARGRFEPPVTTISLRDEVPGQQGWLLAPVTVVLSAQDFSGTGIAAIETGPDRAGWIPFTGPYLYSAEGITKLYYRARDNTLNEEQPRSYAFKIDTRAPTIVVSVEQPTYTRLQPFTAHFSASDPVPGSGLATIAATLDGTPVSDGQTTDLLWYPLGTHVLTVTANDVAGWSTTNSASFDLIATQDSLVGLIQRLAALGEIDSGGVANSLVSKARHGQLTALLQEIRAQSGKHITVRAADLLRGDVEYVIAHAQPSRSRRWRFLRFWSFWRQR